MYDPDDSSRAWTEEEVKRSIWQRDKPTKIPKVGDAVLYRHNHHADVTDAVVVAVQTLDDERDGNLYLFDPSTGRVLRPRADPWPLLTLHTQYGLVETREARVRGSAGWLPADWEA